MHLSYRAPEDREYRNSVVCYNHLKRQYHREYVQKAEVKLLPRILKSMTFIGLQELGDEYVRVRYYDPEDDQCIC